MGKTQKVASLPRLLNSRKQGQLSKQSMHVHTTTIHTKILDEKKNLIHIFVQR